MEIRKALSELRKGKKRNFDQTLDLIVNLKDLDLKRESVSGVIHLPFPFRKKSFVLFLDNKKELGEARVITKNELETISQKEMKKLAKNVDFFIALAKLMPTIAKKFGKVLGSSGKMPNPKLGTIIPNEDEKMIKAALKRLENAIFIKLKELSIKFGVGKESMKDEEIEENIHMALEEIEKILPKGKENIKNVLIKFTMSKPIEIEW